MCENEQASPYGGIVGSMVREARALGFRKSPFADELERLRYEAVKLLFIEKDISPERLKAISRALKHLEFMAEQQRKLCEREMRLGEVGVEASSTDRLLKARMELEEAQGEQTGPSPEQSSEWMAEYSAMWKAERIEREKAKDVSDVSDVC